MRFFYSGNIDLESHGVFWGVTYTGKNAARLSQSFVNCSKAHGIWRTLLLLLVLLLVSCGFPVTRPSSMDGNVRGLMFILLLVTATPVQLVHLTKNRVRQPAIKRRRPTRAKLRELAIQRWDITSRTAWSTCSLLLWLKGKRQRNVAESGVWPSYKSL